MQSTDLSLQNCDQNAVLLTAQQATQYQSEIDNEWTLETESQTLTRNFEFKGYYQTIAFANAVAWMAQQQNHHPDMTISYRHCNVVYTTHSVSGLSVNDFICAARIDALINKQDG